MPLDLPPLRLFRTLDRDGWLLFATRFTRLFAYGFLSVVLVLYLSEVGLHEGQIGLLLTLTLLGDTAISLWITASADRVGRRRMLLVGAVLMALAGAVFAVTGNFWLLLVAATLGVISPSGNEVGPFLPIEQAALSQTVPGERRTEVFAWYNLVGSLATALGSLCGGGLAQLLRESGLTGVDGCRPLVIGYGLFGVLLAVAFARLSPATEVPASDPAAEPPSSLPLRAVETTFAPDSTGFSTSRFVRWHDEKYGAVRSGRDWVPDGGGPRLAPAGPVGEKCVSKCRRAADNW